MHYLLQFSGELSIKGKALRQRFTDRLVHNLADGLRSHGLKFRIDRRWSRIVLECASPEAATIAARVFGVQAVAPAERHPWQTLDDLLDLGERIFAPAVRDKTFAVRVRRGEEKTRIPFRSPEVERRLGARLAPLARGVDLRHPEFEARVELQGSQAFFFALPQPGHGGLPVGTEGRALALFSGGFDSPVAAWSMLRRGVRTEFLFCNLGGREHLESVLAALDPLAKDWCYGYSPRLHVVDFRPIVLDIRAKADPSLWQLLLKRRMYRVAAGLCSPTKAQAIVTGEAIGQVSSQTLHNLAALDRGMTRPILRPLLTWNKDDILHRARQIGTHDDSARVPEHCSLGAKGPATHVDPDKLDLAEGELDRELPRKLVDERMVLDCRSLDLGGHRTRSLRLDLSNDRLPADARLLDLRSRRAFAAWHPEAAIHREYPAILESFSALETAPPYAIYCEFGIKSAHLAEVMAARGYRASYLADGWKSLLREAEDEIDPLLRTALSPALLEP